MIRNILNIFTSKLNALILQVSRFCLYRFFVGILVSKTCRAWESGSDGLGQPWKQPSAVARCRGTAVMGVRGATDVGGISNLQRFGFFFFFDLWLCKTRSVKATYITYEC